MDGQQVKNIRLTDLILWSENPRDPIGGNACNQDIVDMATNDKSGYWDLKKLSKQMGDYYDYSELPTVVYEKGKHIVYDGNRRVILAMISKGLVKCDLEFSSLPFVDDEIPCNVCTKEIAIKNVLRKHSATGSWRPLFRDQFVSKHLGTAKSAFEIIEEATGFISANEKMNQGFVRDEILTTSNLAKMGIQVENGRLKSRLSKDELQTVLEDLLNCIDSKILNTRKSRGNVYGVLSEQSKQIISDSKENPFLDITPHNSLDTHLRKEEINTDEKEKKTRRIRSAQTLLFGNTLHLKAGDVNNLYRDICDLYAFYQERKDILSHGFPVLIRMALRLLCETASNEMSYTDIKDYIKEYYDKAKKGMSQDTKTYLSTQNVKGDTLPQLLHTGAHNYTNSKNLEQTIAISIALGAMLKISHTK